MHDPKLVEALAGVADRFWARVDVGPDDACWEWIGCRSARGYGRVTLYNPKRRDVAAHRVSYWLSGNTDAPEAVMHLCDNPSCVNPAHLRGGTHADNVRDMVSKGRQPRGSEHGSAVLTREMVRQIRHVAANREITQDRLAAIFGVSRENISQIVTGRTWKHIIPGDPQEADDDS